MRRFTTRFFILIALAAGLPKGAYGKDPVRVVVDMNYPPYSTGTAEQATGLYPRLIEEIFSRLDETPDIRALHWKDALKEGEEGRAAVGGIYKTEARTKIYDYSEPLFEEHLLVYVRKGESFPFTRLSDLQGRTIGLNTSWSYGDAFDAARREHRFTVEEADSNLDNFKKLVAGRIDCLVADQVAAAQIIRQENWKDQVEALAQPVAANPAYLVFAKRLQKGEFLKKFDQALEDMKRDGSYQKIIRDYAGDVPEIEMHRY